MLGKKGIAPAESAALWLFTSPAVIWYQFGRSSAVSSRAAYISKNNKANRAIVLKIRGIRFA